MTTASAVTVRRATDADIPLLTQAEMMVSVMPDGQSMWDAAEIGEGHTAADIVAALFAIRAWHWANVEDFSILDVDGAPAALCAVFDASHGEPRIAIDFDRVPELADRLGWSGATADHFARTYRALWGEDLTWLRPQAAAIIETVAVLPAYRGLRLGDRLMEVAKADARARGFGSLGVMVVVGNERAEQLYAPLRARNHLRRGVLRRRVPGHRQGPR